jgi:hypothetical protein
MDLTQSKLTRTEWDNIEIPVSSGEQEILSLIMEGFHDLNITKNKTTSLLSFVKMEKTKENEIFLYDKYFAPIIQKTIKKYPIQGLSGTDDGPGAGGPLKKMKSIDLLRIKNLETNIESNRKIVYEFLVLDFCHELCKYLSKNNTKYAYYLYTLVQLSKASITNINTHVVQYVKMLTDYANSKTDLARVIERAYVFIEQNPYLLEYEDRTLFTHQKQLFSIFREGSSNPRLVLYTAPTGTGKTLSPLGLSVKYRIIFVCVARHIGLALAKSAISMEKKIAFAFGCETASDIRLHYFSAVDFTRDKKSGGIRKVDNSNGSKVEIMICDVKSYLTAMHYMMAFNSVTQIITYWDEPTITMDYAEHYLHTTIHNNWAENKIPNIVLSCATLPKEEEIMDTLADFRSRFDEAEIHTIASYDCKKSIPIITKDGYCALPHTLYADHADLVVCVSHCEENKTLLRYFDLNEIVEFAFYINENRLVEDAYLMSNYFSGIADITMNSLKLYYLDLLKHIDASKWEQIHSFTKRMQKKKFGAGAGAGAAATASSSMKKSVSADSTGASSSTSSTSSASSASSSRGLIRTQSVCLPTTTTVSAVLAASATASAGILITTSDAHTLTDGPTIFLTEDAKKIGNFYIQQSEIPKTVFQDIIKKIENNNKISSVLAEIEKKIEVLDKPDDEKKTKMKDKEDHQKSPELRELYKKAEELRGKLQYIALDAEYVPNMKPHQLKWTNTVSTNAFCPNIDEDSVKEIMALDVENYLKVLLLLGIGLFIQDVDARYLELMKKLANTQDLFMIIASSDFVFGTNYNFCHGFIGKDMANMTQAKTIQCLGRIGRSAIQSTYTVRFREDQFIYNLFKTPEINMEATNMARLFST